MTRNPRCWGTLLQVATVGVMLLWSGSAIAGFEDQVAAPPAPPPPPAGKFDMAFGAAFTSDYISRGITLNGTQPAAQGYIEPNYGLGPVLGDAYVNIWASNTQFDDGTPSGAEIDVAGGIKPKFLGPNWSPNIGYVQYFYAPEEVSPTYGEVYAKTDYKFGQDDKFTLRGMIFFAPDFSQTGKTATFIAGGGKVAFWKNFAAYAGVGYQFFEDPHAFEDLAWTAGLSYYWKSLTFDVRYWDTNLKPDECVVRSGFSDGCDARVVGTISWDLTWSKLMSHGLF